MSQTLTKNIVQRICLYFVFNTLLLVFTGISSVHAQEIRADETILVRSGNAGTGSKDPLITYTSLIIDYGTLTESDFNAARNGSVVYIVAPHHDWTKTIPSDSNAKWVSPNQDPYMDGNSGIYATKFKAGGGVSKKVRVDIKFAADDYLYLYPLAKIYINGAELVCQLEANGNYGSEFHNICSSNSVDLVQGDNYLYLTVGNYHGPTGLLFNATIYVNPVLPLYSGYVLAANTEITPVPTESIVPTGVPTPTIIISPSPMATESATKNEKGTDELPAAGISLNMTLAFFAIGIWAYYFYLRYKIV